MNHLVHSVKILNTSSNPPSRPNSPKPTTSSALGINDEARNLIFQVQVLQARNLAQKDKNYRRDPFLILSLNGRKRTTDVIQKSENPTWNQTFEFELCNDEIASTLEVTCWVKDRFKKEYLGEAGFFLLDIFANAKYMLSDNSNEPTWYTLTSSRPKSKVSGEIQLKFGLIDSSDNPSIRHLTDRWNEYIDSTERKLSSENAIYLVPGNESVGTVPADGPPATLRTSTTSTQDIDSDTVSDSDEATSSTTTVKIKLRKRRRAWRKKLRHFELYPATSKDVMGVVFITIEGVTDLPPERNVTRTGYDMDPFVIISFGKKTFRTKILRHNLNPIYNEKLIFQVLKHEENYMLSFNVYDRDNWSSNDAIANGSTPIQQILQNAPTVNLETKLFQINPDWVEQDKINRDLRKQALLMGGEPLAQSTSASIRGSSTNLLGKLKRTSSSRSVNKSNTSDGDVTPKSQIFLDAFDRRQFSLLLEMKRKERWEAKHQPTLKFTARYVPYPALRQQFWRCLLTMYDSDNSGHISRVEMVTMLDTLGSTLSNDTIDHFFAFARKSNLPDSDLEELDEITIDQAILSLEEQLQKSSSTPILSSTSHSSQTVTGTSLTTTIDDSGLSDNYLTDANLTNEEHIITINECPLCQQPRLYRRSEVDIVTHLATCAGQDWHKVDTVMMRAFVTSSQAHRKWYSKMIAKITWGDYKLGANSANILVQDRLTGQIEEERMSVYVRLGIRLLYRGLKNGTMERQRMQRLLRSLSIKQGRKFDSPHSVREIRTFIAFHKLNMEEVLLDESKFKR